MLHHRYSVPGGTAGKKSRSSIGPGYFISENSGISQGEISDIIAFEDLPGVISGRALVIGAADVVLISWANWSHHMLYVRALKT